MRPEPAWYGEVRAYANAHPRASKPFLARHFNVSRSTIFRILHPETAPPLKDNVQSEKRRQRWADPEWAAQQRLKIKLGMANSDKPIGRARGSPCPQSERPQPWKPGDPRPTRGHA